MDQSTEAKEINNKEEAEDAVNRHVKPAHADKDVILDRDRIISITDFVDSIILEACSLLASDIHIDPVGTSTRIRFRLNGSIVDWKYVESNLHEELIGRIKILSKLRTDVHDRGQDGRFTFAYQGKLADIRVSILPTFNGENAVMRLLLVEEDRKYHIENLGMTETQLGHVMQAISQPHGMIVIVGPTGSGKTTTIYALLNHLSSIARTIVTVEDPVEYVIPNARQIQVSEYGDFTFAKALRSVLRQDPDVIVVGEIRDRETAALAFQASLTGHLVITTLHADGVVGIYSRLRDLQISSSLINCITLAIGQRIETDSSGRRSGVFEVLPFTLEHKKVLESGIYPEEVRKSLADLGVELLPKPNKDTP